MADDGRLDCAASEPGRGPGARRWAPLALPSAELSSAVWLGDAPALTGALAELGVEGVLLGCRELLDDPLTRVQHLTMVATPRLESAEAPPGTRWVEG